MSFKMEGLGTGNNTSPVPVSQLAVMLGINTNSPFL